ncbi:homocysteine/cysteine synthase [Anaeramoeba flamelloides]|uniref:Homocysteine/cysteine synthase n=1 Tax=Anaeramoeba flamelloides TaxID=1746091 RepID=A0ABQ8ZDC5_9EUKA|nr:homocysteine/cysteine synthase [Anaeramoeba flamelloides]
MLIFYFLFIRKIAFLLKIDIWKHLEQDQNTKNTCRANSNLHRDVLNKFLKLYSQGTKKNLRGTMTSSGLQAIYDTLEQNIKIHIRETEKVHIFYSNQLYTETNKVLKSMKMQYSVNIECFELENTNQITYLFDQMDENQIVILFFESVSNPNGLVFDYSLIKSFRKRVKELYVIVDNTWMTGVIFNPFIYDVDVVVSSTTKYYSGGKHIGGVIMSSYKHLITKIQNYNRLRGIHVSPLNLQIIKDNWPSLINRVRISSLKTAELIKKLKSQFEIIHPFGKELYNKYINQTYGPSLILIKVHIKKEKLKKKLAKQSLIQYVTSYGSSYSKIDTWPFSDPKDKSFTWIRLYVGYDDTVNKLYKNLLLLFIN